LTDPNAGKYKGKINIDINCLMFPRVSGLKGKFGFESYDPPSSAQSDGFFGTGEQNTSSAKGNKVARPAPVAKEEGSEYLFFEHMESTDSYVHFKMSLSTRALELTLVLK
jgi:hypothetical protein